MSQEPWDIGLESTQALKTLSDAAVTGGKKWIPEVYYQYYFSYWIIGCMLAPALNAERYMWKLLGWRYNFDMLILK